ncbi:hypothetical protein GCM10011392_18130 [Wenxinia marina]|nr:hypothetical protein GCM10011392_18130 [Wenxinia marina]
MIASIFFMDDDSLIGATGRETIYGPVSQSDGSGIARGGGGIQRRRPDRGQRAADLGSLETEAR